MPPLFLSIVLPGIRSDLLGDLLEQTPSVRSVSDEELAQTDRKVLIWALSQEPTLRLAHGKFPFGSHRNLTREIRYLTLLGNPLAMARKLHRSIAKKPAHPLNALATSNDVSAFFAKPEAASISNPQTRALAGADGKSIADGDPALLDLAKQNIDQHFDWIGEEANLSTSMEALVKLSGVSLTLPPNDAEPVEGDTTIEQANALDCELLDYARHAFVG